MRRLATAGAALAFILLGVVQLPGDGVEEADQAGLADATAKQRVGGEGTEGVVAYFGVGGRGAPVDEGEVVIGGHDGGVEEHQPDVYPQRRLAERGGNQLVCPSGRPARVSHHAILGTLDTFVNHLPPRALEGTGIVVVIGPFANDLLQGKVAMGEDGLLDVCSFASGVGARVAQGRGGIAVCAAAMGRVVGDIPGRGDVAVEVAALLGDERGRVRGDARGTEGMGGLESPQGAMGARRRRGLKVGAGRLVKSGAGRMQRRRGRRRWSRRAGHGRARRRGRAAGEAWSARLQRSFDGGQDAGWLSAGDPGRRSIVGSSNRVQAAH